MLNNDSCIPLYTQLQHTIKNDIINGVYKLGEKMPNETRLCVLYGVSRVTVRKALEELVKEKMLVRKQGKGTFVQYNKVNTTILSMSGFTQSVSKGNHTRTSYVLHKAIIPATGFIAERLMLQEGAAVIEVKRIMSEDGVPIMIDTSYMPGSLYPGIYDKLADNVSVFSIICNDYNVKMNKALKEFSIITANAAISAILNCPPGEPLYDITKVIYSEDDIPIYLSLLQVSSNRAVYSILIYNSSAFDDNVKSTQ